MDSAPRHRAGLGQVGSGGMGRRRHAVLPGQRMAVRVFTNPAAQLQSGVGGEAEVQAGLHARIGVLARGVR